MLGLCIFPKKYSLLMQKPCCISQSNDKCGESKIGNTSLDDSNFRSHSHNNLYLNKKKQYLWSIDSGKYYENAYINGFDNSRATCYSKHVLYVYQ